MSRGKRRSPEKANDRDYYGPCADDRNRRSPSPDRRRDHRSPERANDRDYYRPSTDDRNRRSPSPPHRGDRWYSEKAGDRDYHSVSCSDYSRKRQRQSVKPVFVADIRVPFQEVVDFMNRVMDVEGFTRSNWNNEGRRTDPDGDEVYVGDAIIGFTRCHGSNAFRLEPATDALAKKLCYLNRMPYNHTILRVNLAYKSPENPRYSCWNEFHFEQHGHNDAVLDREVIVHLAHPSEEGQRLLFDFLNEKMKFHGLCEFDDRQAVEHIRGMISIKSYVLTMASPIEADRILFLNGIQLGNNTVTIVRSDDWIGSEPRFKNYLHFLRARSDANAEFRKHRGTAEPEKADGGGRRSDAVNAENQKRTPPKPCAAQKSKSPAVPQHRKQTPPRPCVAQNAKPPAQQRKKTPPRPSAAQKAKSAAQKAAPQPTSSKAPIELVDDSDDEVQVDEEHEESKQLEKENKHLRTVLNAMKHSNDSKIKELSLLMSQLNDLQTQVSQKESEASELQVAESNLKNEIESTQSKVTAVHDSWQAQALLLVEKQQEIDTVQGRLERLNQDVQNVEESLLDERTECQELETVLARFAVVQKQEQGEMAKNASSDMKHAVASSDDAFDV